MCLYHKFVQADIPNGPTDPVDANHPLMYGQNTTCDTFATQLETDMNEDIFVAGITYA